VTVGEEYTCSMCEGVFLKPIPDEEALKETEAIWGKWNMNDLDVVCDVCWKTLPCSEWVEE